MAEILRTNMLHVAVDRMLNQQQPTWLSKDGGVWIVTTDKPEKWLTRFDVDMFGPFTVSSVRQINNLLRLKDDSNSWPILGKFNVTNRAIRRLRNHDFDYPYSYWKSVELEISDIVNDERNWG